MIETVTEWRFINAFMKIRPDNFTPSGLHALYNHFIELEEDIGRQIELDVIAICCEFSEYKDFKELNKEYDNIYDDLEDLRGFTQVIEFDGGIIIEAH